METKYGIYEMLTYGEGMKGLIYSTNYLDKVNQAFFCVWVLLCFFIKLDVHLRTDIKKVLMDWKHSTSTPDKLRWCKNIGRGVNGLLHHSKRKKNQYTRQTHAKMSYETAWKSLLPYWTNKNTHRKEIIELWPKL